MSDTDNDFGSWIGRKAVDSDGDKIGTIDSVYVDDNSGKPEWLAIKTGFLSKKLVFAPIAGASKAGKDLRLAYDKDHIDGAPTMDSDGHLDPEDEAVLYRHYGRDDYDTSGGAAGDASRRDEADDVGDSVPAAAAAERRSDDRDSGRGTPEIDEEAVRARARDGGGRVRLRKYAVTEYVEVGEVQREEVEIEDDDR